VYDALQGLLCRQTVRPTIWRKSLQPSRQFTLADTLALAFAAATVIVFEVLHHSEFPPSGRAFLAAAGITAGFALLAWLAGGVNFSGALAGSAVAFIMAIRDLRMFLALLMVFVVTLAATRVCYSRKQQLRAAEPPGGRTAAQAMANLGVAALVVAIAGAGWPLLSLAALAEAAADTGSSEIGMAFPGKTLLLTTLKPVAPGTDGGISLVGTLAALLGAATVALTAAFAGLLAWRGVAIVICAGFLGTLVDSLLGALMERRGRLNNDMVNLCSTALTVGIAWALG